jgi:hypothetical protein
MALMEKIKLLGNSADSSSLARHSRNNSTCC